MAQRKRERDESETGKIEQKESYLNRVEQAMEIYRSIMAIPNEVQIGEKKFLIYPKSTRHLIMIGERLINSAAKFDELRKLGGELFSGKVPEYEEALKLLVGSFSELFEVIVDIFAIILCDSKRPSSEELEGLREFLRDELTIPHALIIFAIFLEQNSLSPFGKVIRSVREMI